MKCVQVFLVLEDDDLGDSLTFSLMPLAGLTFQYENIYYTYYTDIQKQIFMLPEDESH